MNDQEKIVRLINAVDALLENLDDAGENVDENGETFKDIKELRVALEAVRP